MIILTSSLLFAAFLLVACWPIYRHIMMTTLKTPVESVDVAQLCELFGPLPTLTSNDPWNNIGGYDGAWRLWKNSERIGEIVAAAMNTQGYELDAQREFRRETADVRRCLIIATCGHLVHFAWICRLHTVNAVQFYCDVATRAAVICAESPLFLQRMKAGI